MKSILLFLMAFGTGMVARTQVNTNLVLSAVPPATLSEWSNRKDVLTYIIGNAAGLSLQVKIKTEIRTTDGTLVATTDLARSAIYAVSQSTLILTALDVVPLEFMIFTGTYKTSLDRTGKLPSGNYILCAQLVRPVDYTPASEIKCRSFYLASLQLPILMKPYNEEILDARVAQTAITFRWTPVVPAQAIIFTYHLQVFEILDNQTPLRALRSNQPLLDIEVRGSTQFIWQPRISVIDSNESSQQMSDVKPLPGKPFVWTIQTLDALGNPITQTDGNGEARSEPLVFYISFNKQGPSKK